MTIPEPVMTPAELEAFLGEAFPKVPRAYRVVEVTAEGAVLRLPIGDEHERPGGTVSGPAMMGLADAAAWLATLSRIGPVPLSVTSSLTINPPTTPTATPSGEAGWRRLLAHIASPRWPTCGPTPPS